MKQAKAVPALLTALLLGAACAPGPQADPGPAPADAATSVPGPDIRPEAAGMEAALVSGHPLATAAGYEVLRAGGNAVDAAVTMAAILPVVRPHMNSVGGDAFSLFYEAQTGRVTALNGSGRAAAGATPEFFADQGIDRMPGSGPLSVTVPGAVSAWASALERYGTISLGEALAPAIRIAEEGFVVTTTLADDLSGASRLNDAGQAIYRPGGERLQAGDVLRSPALAGALRAIAEEGPSAMYGGEVGRSLAAFLQELGSPLRLSDFQAHEPEWTEPLSVGFRGRQVHTVPPNSQGIAMLQMVGMAETLSLEEREPNSPEVLHDLVEITKLAFADRDRWVADPEFAEIPIDRLLAPDYLSERAALIGSQAAEGYAPGFGDEVLAQGGAEGDGDTVYLMVVDRWGNAVSWIQSIFSSFGSGLVDPGTGIVLQNRGAGFTLEEGHPNRIAPGKRPFHTLMTGMVTDGDGAFEAAIGTPGGEGQPQSITQGLIQLLVYDMAPQRAVEAPRYRIGSGRTLRLEDRVPAHVREALASRGHEVDVVEGWTAAFGNLQIIHRLPSGVLRTGADMRREGAAMAYQ